MTKTTDGTAFGLRLSAGFAFPGLDASGGRAASVLADVDVTRVRRADLSDAGWEGAAVLTRRAGQRIEAHGVLGHRLTAVGWGRYVIDAPATAVRCAPVAMATWRWQRYLVGQVLPFVALLHGAEVFHASVVERDGTAVAVAGASGTGKSTLAAALLLRGWRLVADDVLVATADGDRVLAHAGTGLLNLRHDAAARLGADAVGQLGQVVGADAEATRIATPVVPGPVALAGLYVLGDWGPAAITRLVPVDPKLLLAASFNFVVQTPARLVRQLDLCQQVARNVPVHAVDVAAGHRAGPTELARRVEAHAGG